MAIPSLSCSAERSQVVHRAVRSAMVSTERREWRLRSCRSACHLTGGVDAVPIAVGSTQRSEVVHRAAGAAGRRWFPQKCVSGGVTGRGGLACHLTAGVEAIPEAVVFRPAFPGRSSCRSRRSASLVSTEKCGRRRLRSCRSACHLTAGVEARPKTFCSTQRSQVGDGVRRRRAPRHRRPTGRAPKAR